MLSEFFIYYYVDQRRVTGQIDFEKGLGRFLQNSGVLANRVLIEPDQDLTVDAGYTYRRYVYDTSQRRFVYDLEFCLEDFDQGRLVWDRDHNGSQVLVGSSRNFTPRKVGGIRIPLRALGVLNDPHDLNTILSRKQRT